MLEPKDIVERQVAQVLPSKEGLLSLMSKRKIRLYHGIDPTSPNLHLGHAVVLRKLRQFQDLGHEVILLFGTFTARIGDPSGRDKAREPLSEKEVKENIRTYRKQAGLILDMKRLRIAKNHTWLERMSIQETQRLASHVTVAQLWERDMFQERKKRGQPVWMSEVWYPLLQGYDSVALDVDLEVGGTDQTFNMLIGRELQRAYHNREKYVLTTPLLLGPDGRKMSKSLGNTINLLDSAKEMHGKIMAVRDELMSQYFELCTDISKEEAQALQQQLSPRDLKAKLAQTITTLYHGEKAAAAAKEEFEKVFKGKELPTDIPEVNISGKEIELTELLVQLSLASSKGEARRLVEQGGVKIAGEVQKNWNKKILLKKGMVVQVGPRRFARVG
ncbi:MAG: tyrosine--tRNA ligase [Candidatus Wildermuthbacteria bacterium RIFCSPLOWO2_01_FULL_47_18]|uniref:Tyrosine--tRNA ligase n=2 Tax=Candidatus Wildermuthiibacteriota TaxID=1817923 RepID=A0A1G2RHF3_9BACT|nr:MAG: tyrosine--tRNA ligase [Candidatus Wildermuthbacteria bacterium RIFCSPHIGHO2_02_FULL_48_16]OHA71958.1 MAG: tyrosine--tRNA ligase [Candidatus Wildermuthbacteria bacterium RIFCSPLOWO2_01_FULL_47_18]